MAIKPEQLVAIEFLSQPKNGGKSIEEIAQACGVSRSTLWRWQQDEEFAAELRKTMRSNALPYVPDTLKAMADSAITHKSAAAAKIILEAAGVLDGKNMVEVVDKRKPIEHIDMDTLNVRIAEYKARNIAQ